MKEIQLRIAGQTHIGTICREATLLSRRKGVKVAFDFNGVKLVASPKKSVSTLLWEYCFIPSRKGASRKKDDPELLIRQDVVGLWILILPNMFGMHAGEGLSNVIGWIAKFVPMVQMKGISFDRFRLASVFEKRGYVRGEFAGKRPISQMGREMLGRYIVGQVIDFLRKGCIPHPEIEAYCKRYEALLGEPLP